MRDLRRDAQIRLEGRSMSGSHIAGKLISSDGRATDRLETRAGADERMAWPAAALLILLVTAGLWWGIIATLRHILP